MPKHRNDTGLEAIRIEGGLLSTALMQQLRHYQLPGQTSEAYDIEKGLKLSDELGRYWRIAQARWQRYSELRQRVDLDHTTLAVEQWLLPLFTRVLGYQINPSEPLQKAERLFPITHTAFDGTVPFVFTGAEYPLDTGDTRFGESGHKRSPAGLLQEYINAEERCMWAFVGNGLTLRLMRDNPAITRPAYVEIDLQRMFDEELYADFTVFWLLLHATRLAPVDSRPDNCYLEQWRNQGLDEGERVLGQLRYGVTQALRIIGTGFVAHPDNHSLRENLKSGELSTDQFFQELLRLIYRMLFLLTTEDRGVLLDPKASNDARTLYQQGYSVGMLRDRARFKRHHDNYSDAWQQLLVTFAGFSTGQPLLAQPALGGLFADDQCPNLDKAELANRYLYIALFNLCYFQTGGVLSRVNYKEMDEELGSIYESLLELIPQFSTNGQWQFGFIGDEADGDGTAGHARKLTGSYYTPHALVQELIKSALEPVLAQRLRENPENPREALLEITVCDPACGSGHFLLAAARRLAAQLARIDAGSDQPTETDYRHALREVISRCIYGVDINPLAVELCRMALWIEAMEPGKPLGFLDAHIRVGNSLVGVLNPETLKKGIPDKAFQPLTGDDKDIAAALKMRNRLDPRQKEIFGRGVADLSACAVDLAAMPEEDLNQVEQKRDAWTAMLYSEACQKEKLRADLYSAAYFAPKTAENNDNVPTNFELNAIEHDEAIRPEMRSHIAGLAAGHRFFHWHIAFPEVFEKGGFDVLLGNPPWERIKIQEKEFFASRSQEIAGAANAASRRRKIEALQNGTEAENALYREFQYTKHTAEAVSLFVRESGRFPLTARGDINLYAIFAEHFAYAVNDTGRAGILVPTGIATDDSTKIFFSTVVKNNRLFSLFDFENREGLFAGVHRSYKFCLLTLGSNKQAAQLSFFATQTPQLKDKRRSFTLSPDEFSLINPNTLTCPVFRSQKDAELTKKIYRTAPILIREATCKRPEDNPWGIKFSRLFDMSNDSSLFKTLDMVRDSEAGDMDYLPLYEAKMVHQFDHRWATYETDDETSRDCTLAEKQDPAYHSLPRYWVDSWQVTLRTAQVPKAVVDAAKSNKSDVINDSLAIWAAGAALLKGDNKKAEALLKEPLTLFNTETSEKQRAALWMAERWPLSDHEYNHISEIIATKQDPFPITRQLLENRRPQYLLGWRDICRSTDERTAIASIIPHSAVGNNFPLVLVDKSLWGKPLAALYANLCSLVFDFVTRHKVGGTHLNFFIFRQLPVLPPSHYSERDLSFITSRVLELSYTGNSLRPFAEDLGYNGAPFPFDPKRRHQLRCELDAYYARLYQLNRDDLRYILDPAEVMGDDYPSETFRGLKSKEMNQFGEYRTRRLVLEAWDKLEAESQRPAAQAYHENPQLFPWPGREAFVYELIPHLVAAKEGMEFDYYRDAAILASRPDNLRQLLPPDSRPLFDDLPEKTISCCAFPSDQHIRPRDIRRGLTADGRIQIDPDSLITWCGAKTASLKFEADLSPLIPLILTAGDVLKKAQSDMQPLLDADQQEEAQQVIQFIQGAVA